MHDVAKAVKAYQKANNIAADGVAGATTMEQDGSLLIDAVTTGMGPDAYAGRTTSAIEAAAAPS
jgi:peptidoglycan hydrolase-like protein with peptidoglycan-binding domain